jgi:sugar O-acyltransferase (sialic acid O-acetyltransferase NeuD family)
MVPVPHGASHPLVIIGTSNIVSDLLDCAWACGLPVSRIITHLPEPEGERNRSLAARLQAFSRVARPPRVQAFHEFRPQAGEVYTLGMTTPARARLVERLQVWGELRFQTLVHPTAYVSPLAELQEGVFVGARSVVAPGVVLSEHVFVNRGVTVGHDTRVGRFSRIQPGAHLGGLSVIGCGVTIGMGAVVCERLVIGDGVVIGAGTTVARDIDAGRRLVGVRASTREMRLQ